jgi:hypothetical protein
MGHPFVFNQIKFHVHALQSCLLFPYALPWASTLVIPEDYEPELPL